MSDSLDKEKPQILETERGFSVLYKNRFLYSKYDPKRAILKAIDSLSIRTGTLVLCASPALWHGIEELCEKMGKDCLALGIETDKNLHEVAYSELLKKKSKHPALPAHLLPIEKNNALSLFLSHSEVLPFEIPFVRRVIFLEFSGGAAFHRDLYREMQKNAEEAIAQFWKNRITLTRLGRLFSRNLFKNLPLLPASIPTKNLFGSVESPILIFGAGESAFDFIKKVGTARLSSCMTICVDAALPLLRALNVKVDAVVALEAQSAIFPSYIGVKSKDEPLLFLDVCARASVSRFVGKKIAFFASEYSKSSFFQKISAQSFFPPTFPPLGSVGLTATLLALKLRKNENVPVIFSGLDFSFSAGSTHARETEAHKRQIFSRTRLSSDGVFGASFGENALALDGKKGKVYTNHALFSYAELFRGLFAFEKNLFDAGETGLFLNVMQLKDELWSTSKTAPFLPRLLESTIDTNAEKNIRSFFEGEVFALTRLRSLLSKEIEAEKGHTLEEEIKKILLEREYLFLHFPDGYKMRHTDVSFLKRIRSEIDFFLKDINNALSTLPSL